MTLRDLGEQGKREDFQEFTLLDKQIKLMGTNWDMQVELAKLSDAVLDREGFMRSEIDEIIPAVPDADYWKQISTREKRLNLIRQKLKLEETELISQDKQPWDQKIGLEMDIDETTRKTAKLFFPDFDLEEAPGCEEAVQPKPKKIVVPPKLVRGRVEEKNGEQSFRVLI